MLLDDNDNDIICMQETWFTKQDLANLNALHPGVHGTGIATVDNRDELYHGHPPGGVSILWRICYDSVITPFKDDKTEENTFEILQHSDRNRNNS